jgi:hypothetical protein
MRWFSAYAAYKRTAVGHFALQYAKAIGIRVIVVRLVRNLQIWLIGYYMARNQGLLMQLRGMNTLGRLQKNDYSG